MSTSPVALVIGIAEYSIKPLPNPVNDANDIASCLESLGFKVLKKLNCTDKELAKSLKEFKEYLYQNQTDIGLFYFAGHGIQIDGKNYLIATDSENTSEIDLEHSSLSLDKLIKTMNEAHLPTKIIILDACRNNPYENAFSRSSANKGLAPIDAPKGTLIAYATSPGQTALDFTNKKNGAYTSAILQHIRTPDLSVEDMFKRVRNTLNVSTKGKQISWEHTSLSGDFFFNQSIGTHVSFYDAGSISDGLFVIDSSRQSHRLIAELRTQNWHRQNPAIEQIIEKSSKFTINSLFVIGRNIYQSACGGSNNAAAYISNFIKNTTRLTPAKRKAVLDGMLFEIFFDSKGRIREFFKVKYFNEIFDLQQYSELAESFAFISECLIPSAYKFYSIPGKTAPTSINIEIKKNDKNEKIVEAIFVGGRNVLHPETSDSTNESGLPLKYKNLDCKDFEDKISLQMLIPRNLLSFTYTPNINKLDPIRFPHDWTAAKI